MSKCLWEWECNITPFSGTMPTLGLSHPERLVYYPVVLILDPLQCVGHLQPPYGFAVHDRELAPLIFALRNGLFEALQLLSQHAEAMYLCGERGVAESGDSSIHTLSVLSSHLKPFQLLRAIHRLSVEMEDRRGVQGFGVHLVAVVAQSNDDGVWVEYDLYILRLSDFPVYVRDGERNEVVSQVWLETWRDLAAAGAVAPLVQREASGGGGVWCLARVVRIRERAYEHVLSWVKFLLAHIARCAAPRAARCWCTDQRSASRAAILAFLLAVAFVNCSSLHSEQTFLIAACDALWLVKGDRQRDLRSEE